MGSALVRDLCSSKKAISLVYPCCAQLDEPIFLDGPLTLGGQSRPPHAYAQERVPIVNRSRKGLCRRFASTFQMLRGTLVIFAGFLTVTLLKRQLHAQHWLGIVLITAGAAIVGASR